MSAENASSAPGTSSASELSDHSLLRRFRGGNQEAATQLYLRYAQRLRNLARAECSPDLGPRFDIDDIVQSVFGSFFRGASKGDYDVPAGDELWKLFLVIALNKIRAKGAFHRAAKRDIRRTVGGADAANAMEAALAAEGGEERFLELVVTDVLEKLPRQHRTMVELRMEGFGIKDIAEKTGRSKRSVERVLQEARKKLDVLLEEEIA
jgi:RNA polymerase sigma-70 factor (ECF subfamily)